MTMSRRPSRFERMIGRISPGWGLRRLQRRIALDTLARAAAYDAASSGRRTQGWRRSSADANAAIGPALSLLRDRARDLVRNNPYAESALGTIADHAVGWGLQASPAPKTDPKTAAAAAEIWSRWAETTDCDADGRNDIYGLQKLYIRTIVESGEVVVRARIRRPEDGLALPLQLQIMEPDFIDTSKEIQKLPNGGRIIQGVEFSPIGQRVAYWLFPEHPGSQFAPMPASVRIPAEFTRHGFRQQRAGQVRGVSWFSPVLLKFRDFDDLEDSQLMKQKIAACLAVLKTDPSGANVPVGKNSPEHQDWDYLEPGGIMSMAAGEDVHVVNPPSVQGYEEYSKTVLRAIATGIGVTYEDLTGDYGNMPFSSARMSRLRHWDRVEDWRWRLLVPQFCDPVWNWAMQTASVMGLVPSPVPSAEWTGKPAPMVDPASEGLALQRLVRGGFESLSNALRERGYDPAKILAEIAADNQLLDKLGLILDSDPRKLTQAGQLQGSPASGAAASNGNSNAGDGDPNASARFFIDYLVNIGESHAAAELERLVAGGGRIQ